MNWAKQRRSSKVVEEQEPVQQLLYNSSKSQQCIVQSILPEERTRYIRRHRSPSEVCEVIGVRIILIIKRCGIPNHRGYTDQWKPERQTINAPETFPQFALADAEHLSQKGWAFSK